MDQNQEALFQMQTLLNNNKFLRHVMMTILADHPETDSRIEMFDQIVKSRESYKKKELSTVKFCGIKGTISDTLFHLFTYSLENNLNTVNMIVIQFLKKHQLMVPPFLALIPRCSRLTAIHLDRVKFDIDHLIVLFENLSLIRRQITDLKLVDYVDTTVPSVSNSTIGKTFKDIAKTKGTGWDLGSYVTQRIRDLEFFKKNTYLRKFSVKTAGRMRKDQLTETTTVHSYSCDPANHYSLFIDYMFMYLSKGCEIEELSLEFTGQGCRDCLASDVSHVIIYVLESNHVRNLHIDNINFGLNLLLLGRFWHGLRVNVSLESLIFRERLGSKCKLKTLHNPFHNFQTKPNLKVLQIDYWDTKQSFTRNIIEHATIFNNLTDLALRNHAPVDHKDDYFLAMPLFDIISRTPVRNCILKLELAGFHQDELRYLVEVVKRQGDLVKLYFSDLYDYPRPLSSPNRQFCPITPFLQRNIVNTQRKRDSLFSSLWDSMFNRSRNRYFHEKKAEAILVE